VLLELSGGVHLHAEAHCSEYGGGTKMLSEKIWSVGGGVG
jgi:hypothetical protein